MANWNSTGADTLIDGDTLTNGIDNSFLALKSGASRPSGKTILTTNQVNSLVYANSSNLPSNGLVLPSKSQIVALTGSFTIQNYTNSQMHLNIAPLYLGTTTQYLNIPYDYESVQAYYAGSSEAWVSLDNQSDWDNGNAGSYSIYYYNTSDGSFNNTYSYNVNYFRNYYPNSRTIWRPIQPETGSPAYRSLQDLLNLGINKLWIYPGNG